MQMRVDEEQTPPATPLWGTVVSYALPSDSRRGYTMPTGVGLMVIVHARWLVKT